MRRVRHSKSGLFLIELMICILFFSCTAGICIRFFAKSHELSQEARNLYQAQQEASSMAEILEGGTDSLYHRYVYPFTARRLRPLRWEMNCVCYLLDRAS